MNAAWIAAGGLAAFALGYRSYSRHLERRVLDLDPSFVCPSRALEDGVDYVPTRRHVLLGHHFASIAGASPIVGPAIAVIWGWLPAVVWVVAGSVLMGAVHDFACLVVSAREGGRSIPDISAKAIHPRVRTLFLVLVMLLSWLVIAVFAWIIGSLFVKFPSAVFPINLEIAVAVAMGWALYRARVGLLWPSVAAVLVLYGALFVGAFWLNDLRLPALFAGPSGEVQTWVVVLVAYCYVASVLPVWVLLQPRDYINFHQLALGLVILYAATFAAGPELVAPALNLHPEGAPPWFPFLFVTIACGAVSGFHGLVASGTTSKQLASLPDARPIGYGGMLGEGALGLLAVVACSAGLHWASGDAWHSHYGSWALARDGGIGAFVVGGSALVEEGLALPAKLSATLLATIVIAFAATTLDTATRIQRHVIAELATAHGAPFLARRPVAGALAAFPPLVLIFGGERLSWTRLWPVFGAANQMLAALCLVVVTAWLRRRGRPVAYTLVPLVLLGLLT
ncbi:MAG: carbon starvation protein A, partial [Planctomycetes bacterium]|nr:carbon starvation protein A [Planctomycetota bacterium]